MSRLLTRLAAAADRPRVAVANNCNWPIRKDTIPQWVHNSWTTHVAGPAGYSQVDLWFVNATLITDGEQAGSYDFLLRAGTFYNGQFYSGLANGLAQTLVDKNYGLARFRVNVTIPPGAKFVVTSQRVAADLGAAGSSPSCPAPRAPCSARTGRWPAPTPTPTSPSGRAFRSGRGRGR